MKRTVKMLSVLLVCVILSTAFCMSIMAADTSVKYVSQAEKFVFIPESTDLFDNFKGVMPGDTLEQKIVLKNERSAEVDVKIYVRAEATDENGEEFLKMLTLKISSEDKIKELNTKPVTDLTKDILIGTLQSGNKADLNVTLDIPIELSDEYQKAEGHIDFIFTAEEIEVPKADSSSQTGDTIILYLCGLLASAAIVAVVIIVRKKAKR